MKLIRNSKCAVAGRLRTTRTRLGVYGGLLLLCCGFVLLVTYLYVKSEHTFYSSDYAGYQFITQQIVATFRRSLLSGVGAIVRSTASEYNALFTIPLIPLMFTFGDSRLTFELSVAVCYLLPFILASGAVAVKLMNGHPHRNLAFWSTVIVALLTPMIWVPTLRGYPDTGAALLVTLALWLHITDIKLRHHWRSVLIGCLIASALLIRRHFAYAVIAFFASLAIETLVCLILEVKQQQSGAGRNVLDRSMRVALVGLAAMATLLVGGFPLLMRGLTINYNALYADYMSSPLVVLRWYTGAYGWLAVLASVTGYAVGIYTKMLDRRLTWFILLFNFLSILEWLFIVRQTGEQYTLHFSLFIVLGISALLWTIFLHWRSFQRVLGLSLIILLLTLNMIIGLTPMMAVSVWPVRAAFTLKEPPLVRNDTKEISALVTFLHQVAGNDKPVYVAASSALLSTGLIGTAERALYGWDGATLQLLYAPQIDSRDAFPLEMLMRAEYVVVADPFQHQVNAGKQRVVQVVFDLFTQGQYIAQDFVLLPETFKLDEGTVVRVYRRARVTSQQTALNTLEFMQHYLETTPGGQPDWILLRSAFSSIEKQSDGTYRVIRSSKDCSANSLLFVGNIPEKVRVTGRIITADQHCPNITLAISRINARNHSDPVEATVHCLGDQSEFMATFAKQDATNLLINLSEENGKATAKSCALTIDQLHIRSK